MLVFHSKENIGGKELAWNTYKSSARQVGRLARLKPINLFNSINVNELQNLPKLN